MKEEAITYTAGSVVIIGVIIFVLIGYYDNRMDDMSLEISYLEESVGYYEIALEEANDNIDDANSIIQEAQFYAWESYDEMGEALEYMSTVDNVREP